MGIIKAIKHGWYSGKGNKNLRNGNYREAFNYYKEALKYSENEGGRAAILECAAKSLIFLNEYNEAASYLEESLTIYKELEDCNTIFKAGADRVRNMLDSIKMDKIH